MAKKMKAEKPISRKAKATAKAVHSSAARPGKLLKAILKEVAYETGAKGVAVAGDAGKAVIGIPLPSFSVEYLLQNNVWPLNRVAQVVGKNGSCKSAFSFEVMRWFKDYAGIGFLNENESKYSPEMALSIIGYPATDDDNVLGVVPCDSVESWQQNLQSQLRWIREVQKEKGKLFPVLLIVDSIMGKLSIETQKQIEKTGHADRAYAIEAMKITYFLKKIPQDIVQWPVSLICVNHLKTTQLDQYRTERRTGGGAQMGFQETFELEFADTATYTKTAELEQHTDAGNDGMRNRLNIKIKCWKNSLGVTGRVLRVPFWWYTRRDKTTGEQRQKSCWDWQEATCNLILDQLKAGGRLKRDIMDIVGLRKATVGRKVVWLSKPLGIGKNDQASKHDIGKRIDENPAVRRALQDYFGVHVRSVYDPTIDFSKQLKVLKKVVDKQVKKQDEEE